ncbi:MAG: GNAT family N-acetyltransferase [Betaproteobacteria bacterium]|nr:GNAT family N-acetyltransferase [Betaproteobacteria bacterium]
MKTQAVPSFTIGPAQTADARDIAQVHVASWQKAYRELLPADYLASLSVESRATGWRRDIESGASSVVVARLADGDIIGFANFGPSRDADAPPRRGELWAIYLQPDHWSCGVGRALCTRVLHELAAQGYVSVSLWVMAGNMRAIRFYERAGFACEPGSMKAFELGGVTLAELRFLRELS